MITLEFASWASYGHCSCQEKEENSLDNWGQIGDVQACKAGENFS